MGSLRLFLTLVSCFYLAGCAPSTSPPFIEDEGQDGRRAPSNFIVQQRILTNGLHTYPPKAEEQLYRILSVNDPLMKVQLLRKWSKLYKGAQSQKLSLNNLLGNLKKGKGGKFLRTIEYEYEGSPQVSHEVNVQHFGQSRQDLNTLLSGGTAQKNWRLSGNLPKTLHDHHLDHSDEDFSVARDVDFEKSQWVISSEEDGNGGPGEITENLLLPKHVNSNDEDAVPVEHNQQTVDVFLSESQKPQERFSPLNPLTHFPDWLVEDNIVNDHFTFPPKYPLDHNVIFPPKYPVDHEIVFPPKYPIDHGVMFPPNYPAGHDVIFPPKYPVDHEIVFPPKYPVDHEIVFPPNYPVDHEVIFPPKYPVDQEVPIDYPASTPNNKKYYELWKLLHPECLSWDCVPTELRPDYETPVSISHPIADQHNHCENLARLMNELWKRLSVYLGSHDHIAPPTPDLKKIFFLINLYLKLSKEHNMSHQPIRAIMYKMYETLSQYPNNWDIDETNFPVTDDGSSNAVSNDMDRNQLLKVITDYYRHDRRIPSRLLKLIIESFLLEIIPDFHNPLRSRCEQAAYARLFKRMRHALKVYLNKEECQFEMPDVSDFIVGLGSVRSNVENTDHQADDTEVEVEQKSPDELLNSKEEN